MAKRKSLGRGLEALLSSSGTSAAMPSVAQSDLKELPIDLLTRGRYQPRVDMHEDTLTDLAESIKAQGVVQPIVVRAVGRANGETRYEIVAGERRWRAAQLAGLDTVPALVRDIPDEAAVAVALIENIQRENLNPIEEARALARLVEEFQMTHTEAAGAVGRSRAGVSNLLRLLELPASVIELLESRRLDMGHGRALLGLDSPELRVELGRRAAQHGWSVRATESAVRRHAAGRPAPQAAPKKDPNVARLETDLAERLGAPVAIEPKGKAGRIVIRYSSLDELEGILGHIK
jgi:ParB family chromosome partitioning protein